jgi:hypothetical protein
MNTNHEHYDRESPTLSSKDEHSDLVAISIRSALDGALVPETTQSHGIAEQ